MQKFKHISIYIISFFIIFTLFFPLNIVMSFDSDSIYVWSDLSTSPTSSSITSENSKKTENNNSSKTTNSNISGKARQLFKLNFRWYSFNGSKVRHSSI